MKIFITKMTLNYSSCSLEEAEAGREIYGVLKFTSLHTKFVIFHPFQLVKKGETSKVFRSLKWGIHSYPGLMSFMLSSRFMATYSKVSSRKEERINPIKQIKRNLPRSLSHLFPDC